MVRNAPCLRSRAYFSRLAPERLTSTRTTNGMRKDQPRAPAELYSIASATHWRTQLNQRSVGRRNLWASSASLRRRQRRSESFTRNGEPSWEPTWTTCGALIQLSGGTQTSNCATAQRCRSVQLHKHSLTYCAGYEKGQLPGPHTSGGRGAVGNGCFGACSLLRVRKRLCPTPRSTRDATAGGVCLTRASRTINSAKAYAACQRTRG